MLEHLDIFTLPLAMLGTGYLVGCVRRRLRPQARPSTDLPPCDETDTPTQVLEEGIAVLMARLEPDLQRLNSFAPGFTGLVTETSLTVLVLEYILRDKGLIEPGEMEQALRLARTTVTAGARLGGTSTVGNA
ncbi:MAG TPA: hypothetical protein VGR62_25035 [Candidatus Binatia bacterium]|jgi:hypothetical protein|nr:hypothetical protein [Candidatus Binatia bacterium]